MTSKILPIYISEAESEPIDILWFENQYCLIKKLHVPLGNQIKTHVCTNLTSIYDEYRLLENQKKLFDE